MAETSATFSKSPSQRRERKPLTAEQQEQAAADRELMRRVVNGEAAAFSSFYRRLAPGLFSMIYEILHDQKDSEDTLQEAFVQMWKKAALYDPARSSLFTWGVMIARNKAIDRLRSRQRRLRTVEAVTAETSAIPPELGEQADELLVHGEEKQRIRGALSQLPEPQRVAIYLAFFRGLTQTEISAKLSEPLGTIKARIRRGLIALRDVLERSP